MNYTLTVSQEDLLIISEALSNMPFKTVMNLIPKLQSQINNQNKPDDGKTTTSE